jgi:hypothetical protein
MPGMSKQKEIVLLRSGRHLHVAVQSLRNLWPDCRVLVVSQPGTDLLLDQLQIQPEDRFIFDKKKFFSPLSLARSHAGKQLRSREYDDVAVLWTDPEGKGHANVDRTAMLLSPRGFVAITPDGSVIRRETWPTIKREVLRGACSIMAYGIIHLFLLLPSAFLRLFIRK